MRICVAAICRNEEKHMQAFLEHVRDADCVSIVDTGSTDRTCDFFEEFDHPNFFLSYDVANVRDLGRSRNLAAAPFNDNDLIVWLDIDERFSDPNWVSVLRKLVDGPSDIDSIGVVMHNGDSVYTQKKMYRKDYYVWRYCAHEVLVSTGKTGGNTYNIDDFHTDHFPDYSKPRNYLNELALDVARWPYESRPRFYYARELCYRVVAGDHHMIDEAIAEVAFLEKICDWKDYQALAHIELLGALFVSGRSWVASAYAAAAARPDRVESYGTACDAFYRMGDNVNALGFAIQGISAYENSSNNSFLFDRSLSNLDLCLEVARWSCQNLGMYDKALNYLVRHATLRGDDVNKSIQESGLVEQLEQTGAGSVFKGASSVQAQSDSQDKAEA